MTNPLSHVGQTRRPEGSEQVQQPCQQAQSQAQVANVPEPLTEPGEHPATRLPQQPQIPQGDDSEPPVEEQQLREPQQDEADDDDAELRHESAV